MPHVRTVSMYRSPCVHVLLIALVILMQIVVFVTVLAGYTLFLHERLAFDVRVPFWGCLPA